MPRICRVPSIEPKTAAGDRSVPFAGWLVEQLRACRGDRTHGLVFASRNGTPLNPWNVRRDIWLPLIKRAGVPHQDMYSLRTTFATLARASGEAAFNVSRMIGHSRSTLVDQVYAHTMQSGMASVAENVTARALGLKPQLRVIEGGNSRDVRQPLDESPQQDKKNIATA